MELNETNEFDIYIKNKKFIERNIQHQKKYELKVSDIFSTDKVELKTENKHRLKNGNFFLEYQTSRGGKEWKDSGISVTKSFNWVIAIEDPDKENIYPIVISYDTPYLLELIKEGLTTAPALNLNSGYPSEGYLLPIIKSLQPLLDLIDYDVLEYQFNEYLKERKETIEKIREQERINRLKEISDSKFKGNKNE